MVFRILRSLLFVSCLAVVLSAWAGEAVWIDVRTADEFASGHVAGAAHIPYQEIVDRIGEVTGDSDELIYVYCRSGRRSGIAQKALQDAGFSRVYNIGGLEDAQRKAEATAEAQ
ncbi:MAG: rhodanese-like domain-containing protein [Xanthomonadales bacterium]|nr:rhodanese-like domain-containing protein [Gammaproteobacteria bacterium]NNJ65692.1 rhodanese-like domain-containing protein [Xanthomonadales bacterium]NNK33798.1 rhodanese-like domain-containing protein [Xanthomonadales bacterium]